MNHQNTYDTYRSSNSFLELVEEMQFLGMDPEPLLKIAANDIYSLHGAKTIIYVETMLDQAHKANNPNDIYLWGKIYAILYNHSGEDYITIH